uniref:DNA repair protein REV1 n=1 Tax=Mesocestoides corti TaxID=53468 RepID=A0A5K3FNT6_MESCO
MRKSARDNNDNGGSVTGWEDEGGYMKAKIRKLESQFSEEPKKSSIFSGIRVYVNGYTVPSAVEIKRLVQENGGTFVQYYSQSAGDFMVAANLPLNKIKKIGGQKVVKASWITDSIAAGQLLPWKNFELYPPRGQMKNQTALPMVKEGFTGPDSLEIPACEEQSSSNQAEDITINLIPENDSNDVSLSPKTLSCRPTCSSSKAILGSEENTASITKKPRVEDILPTASDGYISQFYSRSRLHHLSSWASELRDLVRSLRQAQGSGDAACGEGQRRLRTEVEQRLVASASVAELTLKHAGGKAASSAGVLPRVLMHIDMDCFFVSVCLRNNPELIGLPVAVTHSKGMKTELTEFGSLSEVASCSYEARRFGITNGMHLGEARKLCPDLKTVPYDFKAFHSVSEDLYKLVVKYSLQIEAVSCDEMYVDVTELLNLREVDGECLRLTNPLILGEVLRRHVYEVTQCRATCGFGTNRLLTRLATKRAKPDSQAFFLGSNWRLAERPIESIKIYEVASEEGQKYFDDLNLSELPGVGRQMVRRISHNFGVSTCGQLLKVVSPTQLSSLLGVKTSQRILQLCQGKDSSELTFDRYAKSISAEINYGIRLSSWSEVEKFVGDLAKELAARMANAAAESRSGSGVVGKSLVVHLLTRKPDQPVEPAKFMGHGICNSWTKTIPLHTATADPVAIASSCLLALRRLGPRPDDIRGLGLQMQRLSPASPSARLSHPSRGAVPLGPPNEPTASIVKFLKPQSPNSGKNRATVSARGNSDSTDTPSASTLSDNSVVTLSASLTSGQPPSLHPLKSADSSDHVIPEPTALTDKPVITSTPSGISIEVTENPLMEPLPHQPDRPIEEVNIFAGRSVEQLQTMFATWVTTESDPLEEDLCMLADYLISILPTDLFRVRKLLRILRRLLDNFVPGRGAEGSKTGSLAWCIAFDRLKFTVDRACRLHYGVDALALTDE